MTTRCQANLLALRNLFPEVEEAPSHVHHLCSHYRWNHLWRGRASCLLLRRMKCPCLVQCRACKSSWALANARCLLPKPAKIGPGNDGGAPSEVIQEYYLCLLDSHPGKRSSGWIAERVINGLEWRQYESFAGICRAVDEYVLVLASTVFQHSVYSIVECRNQDAVAPENLQCHGEPLAFAPVSALALYHIVQEFYP